jgi:hypothetical protein
LALAVGLLSQQSLGAKLCGRFPVLLSRRHARSPLMRLEPH